MNNTNDEKICDACKEKEAIFPVKDGKFKVCFDCSIAIDWYVGICIHEMSVKAGIN